MMSSHLPRHQLVAVLVTLADTTWRIVVPTLGLAVLGLVGDLRFGSGPWLTLSGLVIGFALAAFLIARQLKEMS